MAGFSGKMNGFWRLGDRTDVTGREVGTEEDIEQRGLARSGLPHDDHRKRLSRLFIVFMQNIRFYAP
ncbi:hypothetical protein HNR40_002946 [Nonomuraea endophytica]|uniref:Uncharacterized protein n=1 Tax=Nonomuraea endophytica TaxID=714136 RepID=A0A7W8A0W5_9ACTN|nr:hypothetical protein [Nonomuraea endophytica]